MPCVYLPGPAPAVTERNNYESIGGIIHGIATRGNTTKKVAQLKCWKLRTAAALKAWNLAAMAAGSVLGTPMLRIPAMEGIPAKGTMAVVQEGPLTCEAE
jgi:hypothetical protein